MRTYDAKSYKKLVEETDGPELRAYEKNELAFVETIKNLQSRTVIDIGAGYGRVLPQLAHRARNVISIEINPAMYVELERQSKLYKNSIAIEGDALELPSILKVNDVVKPVMLVLQNTLGTVEGDYKKLLSVLYKFAKPNGGELVLSLFRQPALKAWGIEMYKTMESMIGKPDLSKTDFEAGIYVSDKSYVSKWWTDDDIRQLKGLGKVQDELVGKEYHLIRLNFTV